MNGTPVIRFTPLSRELRQMNGIPEVMGAMYDCRTGLDFPQFDSTAVDCSAIELDDLTFRRPGFPPEEVPAGGDTCGVVMLDDLIFCRTSFPPHELSAGRDGDYIWLFVWTGLSVRARPVTRSLLFGHPHGFVYSRLCTTIISLYCLESVDLSNDSLPNYARHWLSTSHMVH